MTVLLFGFGPFLDFDENPTELVVRSLNGLKVAGHDVAGVTLPVDYSLIEEAIVSPIRTMKPALVLGFGLAAGRDKITPEKVAVNYVNSKAKDNSGRELRGVPVDVDGQDGSFTNLPVEGLVDALNAQGVPAALSLSAGAYLCNYAMYVTVREARRGGCLGGFIHVPCHAEWVARSGRQYSSLPLSTIRKAAELSLSYCLSHTGAGPTPHSAAED